MTTRLAGIEAKIARAEYHLDGYICEGNLESHRGVFGLIHDNFYANFHGLVTQQDPDTQQPIIPAHLCEVPLETSVAVGDVVHNLCSALDHLAWALVESNGGSPSEDTDFPIILERLTVKNQPLPLKLDGHIAPGALTEIERLQPYHAGHPNLAAMTPLGKLRELSNVDKHRYLRLMVATVGPGTWVNPNIGMFHWYLLNHLDDGADFAPEEPNVSMQAHLVLQVTIAPSRPVGRDRSAFPKGDEPLYSTLKMLLGEVRQIVDSLSPYLV